MSVQLLEDILGVDGAAALQKAVDRAPEVAQALVPRAALAWARLAVTRGYDGKAPGADVTLLVKNGNWTFGCDGTEVVGQGELGLAAGLLVLVGSTTVTNVGGSDLVGLGKSLDQLATTVWTRRNSVGSIRARARKGAALEKVSRGGGGGGAERPGPAAAPTVPTPPSTPTKPQAVQAGGQAAASAAKPAGPAKAAKLPAAGAKAKGATFARSELEAECGMCGHPQMRGNMVRGCICWQDLVKSARWAINSDRVTITFAGEAWNGEAVLTFLETIRGG